MVIPIDIPPIERGDLDELLESLEKVLREKHQINSWALQEAMGRFLNLSGYCDECPHKEYSIANDDTWQMLREDLD